MGSAEVALDVGGGDLGEVRAALVAVEHALVADGAQQEAAQGAGAHSRFHDACAGEDVGEGQDLACVLGVDHGGAAGHGQDIVGEQGAQREVCDVARGADNAAFGSTDQLVVREGTLVGVEILPGFERERVVAALGVGELYLVPDLEGPASAGGTGRFGHVTSVLASGLGPCHGLHEGLFDVEGGQDAVDGAAGFEDEVFGGGGGAEVVEEFFAGEVR